MDSSGLEKFKELHLHKKLIQNADVILLLYDINSEDSLDNISNSWPQYIKECSNSEKIKVQIYLLGNKIDLDKRVSSKEEAEI